MQVEIQKGYDNEVIVMSTTMQVIQLQCFLCCHCCSGRRKASLVSKILKKLFFVKVKGVPTENWI